VLSSVVYSDDKELRIQKVLDRAFVALQENAADNSVVKVELLLACYRETLVDGLLEQAKEVIMSWGGREMTEGEVRMMGEYNSIVNRK